MTAFPETGEATPDQASVAAPRCASAVNQYAFHLLCGAQRMLLDEMAFAVSEAFERTLTETRLFTEFVSKASEAHSVAGFRELGQECSRHQIDFIRRDCERLFRHSERTLEVASKLVANRPGS